MESESVSVRPQKQSARPACGWRCLVWWESAPRQTGAWIRVSRRCLLCGLCEIPPKRAIPCVRPFVSIWCQKRPSFGLNPTPICEAAAISLGILRNSENENDDVDGCNGTIWLRLSRVVDSLSVFPLRLKLCEANEKTAGDSRQMPNKHAKLYGSEFAIFVVVEVAPLMHGC